MLKKILIGILGLAGIGFMLMRPVFAKISGSGHDFSSANWSSGTEICKPCHTPHNAKTDTEIKAPLWNHTLSTATYKTYSSPSLNVSIGEPSASSKACLSCHDGTVALNAFGGSTGTSTFMVSDARLGSDLSNDHPVSFTYDSTLATTDGTLHDPTTKTVASLDGKTVTQSLLIGNKIECGSCHDVHRAKGDSQTADKLLVINNSGSALCLTCHDK